MRDSVCVDEAPGREVKNWKRTWKYFVIFVILKENGIREEVIL